jgi:hypothetical protein
MRLLGAGARRDACLVLVAGLCTFFAPMFGTSTSDGAWVAWSPLKLASRATAQDVRWSDVFFSNTLGGLVLVYTLLICGLAAVFLPRPRKALGGIAILGSIAGYDVFYWARLELPTVMSRWLLRSLMPHVAVRYEAGLYLLMAIMPVLVLITFYEDFES